MKKRKQENYTCDQCNITVEGQTRWAIIRPPVMPKFCSEECLQKFDWLEKQLQQALRGKCGNSKTKEVQA
jgi:hypothetical protein